MVWLADERLYLGMISIHRDYNNLTGHTRTHYTQAFITIFPTSPFYVVGVSPEFCFQSHLRRYDCERVQSNMSLELSKDFVVISYDTMDVQPTVVTVKLSKVLGTLRPNNEERFEKLFRRPGNCSSHAGDPLLPAGNTKDGVSKSH